MWTTNFVDQYTGTLQRTVADGENVSGTRISDSYYSYDASGTITSNARKLTDATGSTWDNQCYTYDALGELVHAWTSKITPDGSGTGCRSSGGTNWGYQEDATASGGPVTDAPDTAADTTSPDAGLTASLAAAAPAADTVSTGTTAYRQSFTFDWLGNRATLTEHDTADATKNVTYKYGYGREEPAGTQPHTLSWVSSTPRARAAATPTTRSATQRSATSPPPPSSWTGRPRTSSPRSPTTVSGRAMSTTPTATASWRTRPPDPPSIWARPS